MSLFEIPSIRASGYHGAGESFPGDFDVRLELLRTGSHPLRLQGIHGEI